TFKKMKTNMEGIPVYVKLVRKDGSEFIAEVTGKNLSISGKKRVLSTIRDITTRMQVEETLEQTEQERETLLHSVGERVKELKCMFGVTESIRNRKTIDEIFQDTANLIPSGWHYPEITRGKLIFDGEEYVSETFIESEWKQSSDILVNGKRSGSINVFYLEMCRQLDEGPFMKEE
ncbi:unnamed protein product, partial [marine sediment metagenome]